MTRRWIITPIAALAVVAAYVGWRMGQPVTEAQIIAKFAAHYVAEQGGGAKVTDCTATPDPRSDLRLVVRCSDPAGVIHTYYSGPRGELRTPDDTKGPQA